MAGTAAPGAGAQDSLDDADVAGHTHRQDDDARDADAQLEALLPGLPVVWKRREVVSLRRATSSWSPPPREGDRGPGTLQDAV